MLLELLAVLAVIWVPLALAGRLATADRNVSAADQITSIAQLLGELALLFFLVWRNGERFSALGFRRVVWWRELCWAALVCALGWIAHLVVEPIAHGLAPSESTDPRWHLPLSAPLDYLIAAANEEVMFRGYLWTRVQQLTGSNVSALLVTTLLFAFVHDYDANGLIQVAAFGLMAGVVYWHGRSTPRLILGHAAFNVTLHYCA